MSYQFEDDSALEELLNQQLDRRKHQTTSASSKQNRNSNRPTTGPRVKPSQQATPTAPLPSSSAFRPSTASSLLARQAPTALERADGLASSLPSSGGGGGGKSLSSWLQGGSSRRGRADGEKVAAEPSSSLQLLRADAQEDLAPSNTNREVPRAKFAITNTNTSAMSDRASATATATELDSLLSPSGLQEMSKQRLIQVILEELAPRLANQKGLLDKESAREVDMLEQELQMERNRLEVSEMRQEERLQLERQKWQQINQQLEARLAGNERQLDELVTSQREHLGKLEAQYHSQLARLTEMFDQRLEVEKRRFEELLKSNDEMHKLELEAKLNVNCDLAKLDSLQLEWRRTLEMTIQQLSDHYKSVESLLERQASQVNGTNSELAKKTQQLCDQYDNYDKCNQQLASLATEMNQLMPRVAQVQVKGELVLDGVQEKLVKLESKLDDLASEERQLEQKRLELSGMINKMNEDKFQLALDSSRVSMKEERLDELLTRNSAIELQLSAERKSLGELQTQVQLRRLALDERFADLKEQNYAQHLLRKRLTTQQEELLKGQLELAEEKKESRRNRAQLEDELKSLGTLRNRTQRELDQLRRLQGSLVCSLCMSRLFDVAPAPETVGVNMKQELSSNHNNQQHPQDDEIMRQLGFLPSDEAQLSKNPPLGVGLANRVHHPTMVVALEEEESDGHKMKELDLQRKHTELEKIRLAAENRYVEQLFG